MNEIAKAFLVGLIVGFATVASLIVIDVALDSPAHPFMENVAGK